MDKLKLGVMNLDGNELIIREGDALPLKEPMALVYTGDLKCVRSYIDKHKDQSIVDANAISPAHAVILVDKKAMTICLKTNPQDVYGTVITGKLALSDELVAFGINQPGKQHNRKPFLDLIRFNRIHFSDMDTHSALVSGVQQLSVSNTQKLDAKDDTRGNKSMGFDKTVNSDKIPMKFVLDIPLFNGYEKVKVMVDVCLDVSEANVVFWLESVELSELLQTKRDELMKEQLEGLDATYVVMNAC